MTHRLSVPIPGISYRLAWLLCLTALIMLPAQAQTDIEPPDDPPVEAPGPVLTESFEEDTLASDGERFTASQSLSLPAAATLVVSLDLSGFEDDTPPDVNLTLVGSSRVAFTLSHSTGFAFTARADDSYTLTVDSPVAGALNSMIYTDYYAPSLDERAVSQVLSPFNILDQLLAAETTDYLLIPENQPVSISVIENSIFAGLARDLDLIGSDDTIYTSLITGDLFIYDADEDAVRSLTLDAGDDLTDLPITPLEAVLIDTQQNTLAIDGTVATRLHYSNPVEGSFFFYVLDDETGQYTAEIVDEPAVAGLPDEMDLVEVLPGPPVIRMIYDDSGFTLSGITDDSVNVSGILFESEEASMEGNIWARFAPVDLSELEPGRCLQVYVFGEAKPDLPDTCNSAVSFFATGNANDWFWQDDFIVSQGDTILAVCEDDPGICESALP